MANPIMTIRPPDKMRKALKEIARGRGLTLNALILQILWDWIRANETDQCGRNEVLHETKEAKP